MLKLKDDDEEPSQPKDPPPDSGNSTATDGSSTGKEEKNTKHPAKRYVESSWQKHGYYKKDRTYVKSSICHRNSKLLTTT